jgi:hypothetical protein
MACWAIIRTQKKLSGQRKAACSTQVTRQPCCSNLLQHQAELCVSGLAAFHLGGLGKAPQFIVSLSAPCTPCSSSPKQQKKKDLSVHAKGSQVQSNMPFEYTKCFASSSCNLRTTQIWWTFSYRKKKTCKDITCLCFFHMTCQMWASREATGSHSFCKCM